MESQLSQEVINARIEIQTIVSEQTRTLAHWRDRLDRVQVLMRRKSSAKWSPDKTRKMTARRAAAQQGIVECERVLTLAEENLTKLK